jgi:hypothetical protein
MAKYKVHSSITIQRVIDACEGGDRLDNPGMCLGCGADADGCEPDARRYDCEECGFPRVYGCEQILLMGVAHKDAPRASTSQDGQVG